MKKNNILIIGQGNIGTFLGVTLSANEQITHLVRINNIFAKDVKLNFTDRRSKKFRITKGEEYQYQTIDDLAQISNFDLIIIPVAHYDLGLVLKTIKPNLVPKQVLVIMGNIWDDFNWLREHISNPYIFAFPNFGGVIVSGSLEGWLTQSFTIGVTNPDFTKQLLIFEALLTMVGFTPQIENDMKGWLMTHFAYNAGMLLEAAKNDGFQRMTKNIKSLNNMYNTMEECMKVVGELDIDVKKFKEGKTLYQAKWWNVFKTYLMFFAPGLAKNADATKNIKDWTSYSKKVWETAHRNGITVPILNSFHKEKSVKE